MTIGVPVYNGERYLREALNSLFGQTYSHIEIIVSDNASDDATPSICQEFVERDAPVRYQRSDKNHGAVWNFNRVFHLSQGAYFMWSAADDIRDPEYVERCVEALERQPNAILCCTGIRNIDEFGHEVRNSPWLPTHHVVGPTRRQRLLALARANGWYDIYGLIRADALARTRLAQPIWGFDVLLLIELCLQGEVVLLPEPLFSYRVYREKTGTELAATLASPEGAEVPESYPRLALEAARTLWRAPLPLWERTPLAVLFLTEFCVGNRVVRIGIADRILLLIARRFISDDAARRFVNTLRRSVARAMRRRSRVLTRPAPPAGPREWR